jgi:hypothetical protein
MDKDRDSSGNVDSKEELQRQMDVTRRSMSETVDEIKGELSQALKWQTYVRRYPGAFLIGGGALGVMLGRAMKGSAPELPGSEGRVGTSGRLRTSAIDRTYRPSGENSTVRRVAEMLTSAVIGQAVPIISAKLKKLMGAESFAPDEESGRDRSKKESWLH